MGGVYNKITGGALKDSDGNFIDSQVTRENTIALEVYSRSEDAVAFQQLYLTKEILKQLKILNKRFELMAETQFQSDDIEEID